MQRTQWLNFGLTIVFLFSVNACEKFHLPNGPNITRSEDVSNATIAKIQVSNTSEVIPQTHWEATEEIAYLEGGKVKFDKVFDLKVRKCSMIPAEDHIIWGKADYDPENFVITFEFGPSGLAFEPNAELTLRWDKLGVEKYDVINLNWYNPETGAWEKIADSENETNKNVKWKKAEKKVTFKIPHFSLYSLSKY